MVPVSIRIAPSASASVRTAFRTSRPLYVMERSLQRYFPLLLGLHHLREPAGAGVGAAVHLHLHLHLYLHLHLHLLLLLMLHAAAACCMLLLQLELELLKLLKLEMLERLRLPLLGLRVSSWWLKLADTKGDATNPLPPPTLTHTPAGARTRPRQT